MGVWKMSLNKYVRQINPIQESKQKKLLVMGDTTAAYDMEKVIVSAAGGSPFTSKLIPNSDEIGKKIINDLKLTGKGSFPKNTYPASKKWNEYFPQGAKGSTLTPKTDLKIGDRKISLKTGDAQLMSGGVNEASATFYVAAETSGTSLDKAVTELGKHMNNLLPSTDMRKLGIKGNKTQLQKVGKFAEVEVLKRADEAHRAFKDDLRKVFKNNPSFAQAFTFEAMTGKVKFDDSDGTADHFLVTDYEGNATIHKTTSMTDDYVKKISKQVKPDVKFKATQSTSSQLKTPQNPKGKTGYYTFWSAVGLGVKMIVEDEIKNGEMLNENFLNILKRIGRKVTNFFKRFWNKIKKIVSQSFAALVRFMGLEVEVGFNNQIKW
tara:strand:+ start:61 stop:1194 length:1134 start_codon:yes stop_codon:yes gene_type:complete